MPHPASTVADHPVHRLMRGRVTAALALVVALLAALVVGAPMAAAAATGSISGRVTGPNGEPMTTLRLTYQLVTSTTNTVFEKDVETVDGTYRIDGLAPGDYLLQFEADGNYVPEWWKDTVDVRVPTTIRVGAGAQVTRIDATLAVGAKISGVVTDSNGAPLEGVVVRAMESGTIADSAATTGADGRYTVQRLPGGSYVLSFDPWLVGSGNYAAEWWDNADDLSSAVYFPLGAGQSISGKNAKLDLGATITGVVTGPGGTPIPGASVWYDKGGSVAQSVADDSGVYTIKGLHPGSYRLRFEGSDASYRAEYWNDQASETTATRLSVAGQKVYSGINAQLRRPVPRDTPSVAGTARVGGTLTAKPGTWASGVTFGYQWSANGVAITGATAATFTPTAAQLGKVIRVKVTGRKSGYDSVGVTSAPTLNVIDALVRDANPQLGYQGHVQNIGWQPWVTGGKTAGTTGRSLRVEALRFRLNKPAYSGGITASAHVQNIGWMAPVATGGMVGTSGRSLRVEAFTIKLTGEMAKHYDIYYRTHAQNFGWLGWAKNGGQSGTAGYSYRLEAVDVRLVAKGDPGPAGTGLRAFYQR